MINPSAISTISELRLKTKEVLKKADKEPVFLFSRSTLKGVILSYKNYKELIDLLEDYYLSLKAEDFEKEDKDKVKWIPHEKLKKQILEE